MNPFERIIMAFAKRVGEEILDENRRLKNRVLELEKERDWEPLATAPKDGRIIIISWAGQSFVSYWGNKSKEWRYLINWAREGILNPGDKAMWTKIPTKKRTGEV